MKTNRRLLLIGVLIVVINMAIATQYAVTKIGYEYSIVHAVKIMYINVSAVNYTYMRIWLHGDRGANANSTTFDRTTILMFNNGTIVNATNTTAWTLAPGNGDSRDMCSNVSNRTLYSSNTTWDNTSHVRYSYNDSIGYGVGMFNRTISNASDFVWVQIAIDIPNNVDIAGAHTGTIWIHFEADTTS